MTTPKMTLEEAVQDAVEQIEIREKAKVQLLKGGATPLTLRQALENADNEIELCQYGPAEAKELRRMHVQDFLSQGFTAAMIKAGHNLEAYTILESLWARIKI